MIVAHTNLKTLVQDRTKMVNAAIAANKATHNGNKRRANESPWWEYWVRKNPTKGHADYNTAVCIVPRADGSGPDGTERCVKETSRPLEKYIQGAYPDLWKKTDALINPHKHMDTTPVADLDVPAESYRPMCKTNVEECNMELVKWFMQNDRAKHMVCDAGFAEFIQKIQLLPGLYKPPSEEELAMCYKRRAVLGEKKAAKWIQKCKAHGRKPSISGDIWGQGDISILAIVGYAIFDNGDAGWEMEEVVLGVIKFSHLKHTGAHVLSETQKALVKVGLPSMYDDVWRKAPNPNPNPNPNPTCNPNSTPNSNSNLGFKVSDSGSNMKKGWRGFDGGDQTCADHKIERSVVIYMAEPEVAEMKTKRKALSLHLVRASQSKKDVKEAQLMHELPTRKAQREGATRWRSEHAC